MIHSSASSGPVRSPSRHCIMFYAISPPLHGCMRIGNRFGEMRTFRQIPPSPGHASMAACPRRPPKAASETRLWHRARIRGFLSSPICTRARARRGRECAKWRGRSDLHYDALETVVHRTCLGPRPRGANTMSARTQRGIPEPLSRGRKTAAGQTTGIGTRAHTHTAPPGSAHSALEDGIGWARAAVPGRLFQRTSDKSAAFPHCRHVP